MSGPPGSAGLRRRVARGVEELFPGYFALVMATGIVSIACHQQDLPGTARVLLGVNLAAYGLLGLMLLARIVAYPRQALRDLCDHGRGPGFFTVAAGTCVLGTQLFVVAGGEGGSSATTAKADARLRCANPR